MMATLQTPTTLSTSNLYSGPTDMNAGPVVPPQDTRTQYTGTLGAGVDTGAGSAQNTTGQGPQVTPPPPPAPSGGSQLASYPTGVVSGYPSMTPQQAYNTLNFYYGDSPGGGGSTPGAAAYAPGAAPNGYLTGNPMTDTFGGGGSTLADYNPGQHAVGDVRYTSLGGVGPTANVAQGYASNLDQQAVAADARQAPSIYTGAVNLVNGGAGQSMDAANVQNAGVDLAALGLAGTANGAAAQGQLNVGNALYGATAGQAALGQLSTAGQLAGAANGQAYTGQLGTANQLAMAGMQGPAYTNLLGAGQQLQALGANGGFNTAADLYGAAYGPGILNQNALADALASSAYGDNTVNQAALAARLTGTSAAPEILNQNALAAQLAGQANGPAAANQGALAAQLAAQANGPTTAGQLALANRLAAIGAMPAGPSVAQQQLNMGADAAMQQQMAMASAARGGNAALALQNAAQNQGTIMGSLNQQQSLLRAQEDMANRQLAAQTTAGAAGLYGNVGAQQQQALGQAAGLYGNLNAQQAAALQNAAGLYGSSLGQQQQAYNTAAGLYGNIQGQQAAALQGAAGTYGQSTALQGNLLGAASQTDLANRQLQASALQGAGGLYSQAGNLQGSLLGAAQQGFAGAGSTQAQMLGAANQGYTAAGQLTGNLLGQAGQAYTNAAGTQQAAFNNSGQLLQGVANNQLGQANTQAGIAQTYADLAKSQAGLQLAQTGQNDQTSLALQQAALQTLENQRNAEMNLQEQNIQSANTRYGIAQGVGVQQAALQQQADQANMSAGLGAAGLGISLLAALSDVRKKTNIAPASGEVADAFRPLSASSYLYQDPNAPGAKRGTQYGPMAQQLEQTPAGRTAVVPMPDGSKGIDTGRLSLLTASRVADIGRKVDALSGQADAIRGTNVMPPMGGVADMHLRPELAPKVPAGAARPFAPGEYVNNPDGSWSSERSMTVQNPDGSWTVVPSVWIKNGRPYEAKSEDEAQSLAAASKLPFQKFGSLEQAEKYAVDREAAWQPLQRPEDAASIPPLWAPQQSASSGNGPSLYADPANSGLQPNMLYQVPNRAPMVTQLPTQTPAVTALPAPMAMSTPNPGAVFGRYGMPDFDYGGLPQSAPATVAMPTLDEYKSALAGKQRQTDAAKKQAGLTANAPFGWYIPPKQTASQPSLYGGA